MNISGDQRGVHYGPLEPGKLITPKLLFGNRVQPRGRDVRQGHAGDCYNAAATSAYGEFHKDVIREVFMTKDGQLRRSPRGTPKARFFEHDRVAGGFKPVEVTYAGRVPLKKNDRPILNKNVDHRTWSANEEYAFTKFRDQEGGAVHSDNPKTDRTGWNRTANGGIASHVMEALTGKRVEQLEVHPHKEEQLWARLKAAQAKNEVVVVDSMSPNKLRHRIEVEIHDGHRDERARPSRFDNRTRWVSTHSYAAWGDKDHPFVFEKNGVRMIRLRNPWGEVPPGGRGKDGVGEIPFKTFLLRYFRMFIGASSAKDE